MMKLELKHIIPYAIHGLEFWNEDVQERCTLFSIDINSGHFNCLSLDGSEFYQSQDYILKPILKPLSDLSKAQMASIGFKPSEMISVISIPYCHVDWLYQKHFDVQGLIELGIAKNNNNVK